jgi:hypothetical protein
MPERRQQNNQAKSKAQLGKEIIGNASNKDICVSI